MTLETKDYRALMYARQYIIFLCIISPNTADLVNDFFYIPSALCWTLFSVLYRIEYNICGLHGAIQPVSIVYCKKRIPYYYYFYYTIVLNTSLNQNAISKITFQINKKKIQLLSFLLPFVIIRWNRRTVSMMGYIREKCLWGFYWLMTVICLSSVWSEQTISYYYC